MHGGTTPAMHEHRCVCRNTAHCSEAELERDAGERSASPTTTVAVPRGGPSEVFFSSLPTLRAAAERETPYVGRKHGARSPEHRQHCKEQKITQHTYNNNTEISANYNVNNTNKNKTTTTQKNHTQRQVSKQGNGINGKETSKTSRGTHMTKTIQERRER